MRIYKTYGSDAVQVMTENPYRLARDVRGIGFKTADAIAMRLGVEKTAMIRLRAGVSFALAEAMDEGHCGLPTRELIPLAESLLEAPADLIGTALDLERSEGVVVADRVGETDCMFLAGLYRAEQTIADRLIGIAGGKLPWPSIDADKAVGWVEERGGLTLADASATRSGWRWSARRSSSPEGRASAKPPSSSRSCAFWGSRASGCSSALRPGAPQSG